ncbi:MAG TPA: aminotransferase class IV [Phnomibacter sp.]|nr:aminotransferase class IV [Phnomibacter sp.]
MAACEFVWINGTMMPAADAGIGIHDAALNRGYGVFDFLKTAQSIPLFVESHLNRLFFSAGQMHLSIAYTRQEIHDTITQLIAANKQAEIGVKILVTGGYSNTGYSIGTPNIIISGHPLPAYISEQYEQGIRVITHSYQREMPQVKTINYTRGLWLQPTIEAAGALDVIYTHDGNVLETPRSNVFVVDTHGRISTAKDGVLHGITRKTIIETAATTLPIFEEPVRVESLHQASEVFLTSTTKGVLPITIVDGQPIGNGKPGPVAQALSALLQKATAGYVEQKLHPSGFN